MYGYIYLTTNLINGKKYVGSHKSDCFTEKYKGSGSILKKAIDKYGENNFKVEMIEECSNAQELIEIEEYWIKRFNAVESEEFYNLSYSGYKRGVLGYKHTEETKSKISESTSGELNPNYGKKLYGENNPFYGKTHTEEVKEIISKTHKGKVIPEKTREKIRIANTGRTHSEETKEKISNGNKGKIVSEESRRKMSEVQKGRKISQETKEKKSRKNKEKGIKPPSANGKKWITNEVENKLILPEEIDYYIAQGYKLGRKKETNEKIGNANKGKTVSDETKQKLRETMTGRYVSEETRKKKSIAISGENNPMYGKHHSEETKQKLRETSTNRVVTQETRDKISKIHKEKIVSEETREKISKARIGKSLSPLTEEHKQKLREANIGEKNPQAKSLFCLELNSTYGCIQEASRETGIHYKKISRCCNGEIEKADGLTFKFLNKTN